MIGPVKQEDEWDRPRIVRYHDIVSDTEIEKVKELAKPRVSQRQVQKNRVGSVEGSLFNLRAVSLASVC